MPAYIVTGLGFGDEAKGSTVDYLARQGSAVVVRHNGGPQAAHNVVTDDGRHHTFSQFGSGTFAGATTYLSDRMLINPLNMESEAQHLIALGETDIWDRTYVDLNAKIVTPYHIEANRAEEDTRGTARHGSCGQGVGVAMRQHLERPDLTVRVSDLVDSSLTGKLDALWKYFDSNLDRNLCTPLALRYFRWALTVNTGFAREFPFLDDDNLIFEGAQGVLLDEWHGFHPHTTWSTTTHQNALDLLEEIAYTGPVTRLGITRAYMTRHGPGPFVTEDPALAFNEPHNAANPWQGAFRQGHLDLPALKYAVAACGGVDQLVVTHLDRREWWRLAWGYHRSGLPMQGSLPVAYQDLQHQAELTERLISATPVYGKYPLSESGLLAVLEEIAPIGLTSRGPTASQKVPIEIKVS